MRFLEVLCLNLTLLLGLGNLVLAISLLIANLVLERLLFELVGLEALFALFALLLVVILGSVGVLLKHIDFDAELLFLLLVGLDLFLRRRQPVSDQVSQLLPSLVELGKVAVLQLHLIAEDLEL